MHDQQQTTASSLLDEKTIYTVNYLTGLLVEFLENATADVKKASEALSGSPVGRGTRRQATAVIAFADDLADDAVLLGVLADELRKEALDLYRSASVEQEQQESWQQVVGWHRQRAADLAESEAVADDA